MVKGPCCLIDYQYGDTLGCFYIYIHVLIKNSDEKRIDNLSLLSNCTHL